EHEGLGRALFEAPHIDEAGCDHLARVDARHARHRHEDSAASEHFDDETEHPRRSLVRAHDNDDVAHLADLIAVRVVDEHAREARDENSARRDTHDPKVTGDCGWLGSETCSVEVSNTTLSMSSPHVHLPEMRSPSFTAPTTFRPRKCRPSRASSTCRRRRF